MIPEFLELTTIFSSFIDLEYCKNLYSESFLGLLKSYHRKQIGLDKHPSIAEFVYPQIALPSLTLGLGANNFQGGEEISGYIYIIEEIVTSFNIKYGSNLLSTPHLIYPPTPYLVGTDGKYMITENSLLISSSPEDIRATVGKITQNKVLSDWYDACGGNKGYSSKTGECSEESREEMVNFLIEHLEPFRTFKISNSEILGSLTEGANRAKETLRNTTSEIKSVLNIPTF